MVSPIEKKPPVRAPVTTTRDKGMPPNPPTPADQRAPKNFGQRDAAPTGARKRMAAGGMAKKGMAAGGMMKKGYAAGGATKKGGAAGGKAAPRGR